MEQRERHWTVLWICRHTRCVSVLEISTSNAAMLPLSMLSQRVVWSSCPTYFFLAANMMATSFYKAIYFQAVRGNRRP
jgi:hypothetical protein